MEAFTLASPGGWHAINEDGECEEKHRSGFMQAVGGDVQEVSEPVLSPKELQEQNFPEGSV